MSTIRFLLSRGADPDLRGRWGRAEGTPEQFAQARGHREAAQAIRNFRKVCGAEDSGRKI